MILLILRLLSAASLLAFLGLVAVYLRRDLAQTTSTQHHQRGRLVVINAVNGHLKSGDTLPLGALTTLGRAAVNTIQIEDDFASNQHAQIVRRGSHWWLEDRASSNGTLLNGIPIEEPIALTAGDIIEIGVVKLKVDL